MTAPHDWTAEDFSAALAFDERYYGFQWADESHRTALQSQETARTYFVAGWRAHLIAQHSLDFRIVRAVNIDELSGKVTDALRVGWTLAGPPFVYGLDVCQAMTRSERP